jgi:hypothetical protein
MWYNFKEIFAILEILEEYLTIFANSKKHLAIYSAETQQQEAIFNVNQKQHKLI